MFYAAPVLGVPDCITHTESVQRKHRCDIVWGNAEQSLEYITVIILDWFYIHLTTYRIGL